MQLFYITLVFVLQNTLGEIHKVEENITSFEDFPQMEYPKTIFDAVPFNLEPRGILDPFPEDVKMSFKDNENIIRNGKKTTAATLIDILAPVSNKDGSITDLHNLEYTPFEETADEVYGEKCFNIEGADKLPTIITPKYSEETNKTRGTSNQQTFESKESITSKSSDVKENNLFEIKSTEHMLPENEDYLNNHPENQESNFKIDNQEIVTDNLQKKQEIDYENPKNESNNDVNSFENSENLTNEDTVSQTKGPFNDTDLKREKRSPNMSWNSTSFEHSFEEKYMSEEVKNSATTTTAHTCTSSDAVLPRPPLATDSDDGIIIEDHDGSNEDSFYAPDCVENCVVDHSNVKTDDHDEDF